MPDKFEYFGNREIETENVGQAWPTDNLAAYYTVAAAYADTIIAMKNGKIEKIGSPQQIITNENLKAVFNLDAEVVEYQGKPLIIHHI